jgi:serine/threonine protein kinase
MSRSTLSDFVVLGQLGKGSYGTVFKVRRKADERLYVMKQISMGALDERAQRECVQEVTLLAAVDSTHVVRYYDSFLENDCLHIIMSVRNWAKHSSLTERCVKGASNVSASGSEPVQVQVCN